MIVASLTSTVPSPFTSPGKTVFSATGSGVVVGSVAATGSVVSSSAANAVTVVPTAKSSASRIAEIFLMHNLSFLEKLH